MHYNCHYILFVRFLFVLWQSYRCRHRYIYITRRIQRKILCNVKIKFFFVKIYIVQLTKHAPNKIEICHETLCLLGHLSTIEECKNYLLTWNPILAWLIHSDIICHKNYLTFIKRLWVKITQFNVRIQNHMLFPNSFSFNDSQSPRRNSLCISNKQNVFNTLKYSYLMLKNMYFFSLQLYEYKKVSVNKFHFLSVSNPCRKTFDLRFSCYFPWSLIWYSKLYIIMT